MLILYYLKIVIFEYKTLKIDCLVYFFMHVVHVISNIDNTYSTLVFFRKKTIPLKKRESN